MNPFAKKSKTSNNLELVIFPNSVLTRKADEVKDPLDSEIQELIPQMFETMKKENGIGLAAPQINKSLQLTIIDFEGEKFTIINPKIVSKSSEKIIFPEGCLSFPGQEFPIIRSEKIIVHYTDEFGKANKLKTKETLAVIFQHEIDHLNGILMSDRFAEQKPLREKHGIPDKV